MSAVHHCTRARTWRACMPKILRLLCVVYLLWYKRGSSWFDRFRRDRYNYYIVLYCCTIQSSIERVIISYIIQVWIWWIYKYTKRKRWEKEKQTWEYLYARTACKCALFWVFIYISRIACEQEWEQKKINKTKVHKSFLFLL